MKNIQKWRFFSAYFLVNFNRILNDLTYRNVFVKHNFQNEKFVIKL